MLWDMAKNDHILFLWKFKKKHIFLFTSDHSLFIADSFDMCKNYHNFCKFLKEINSHTCGIYLFERMVWFMVFSATFNNISVILWRSVLMVEETGIPGENHQPFANH